VVGSPDKNLIPADDLLASNAIDSFVGEATSIDRDAAEVVTADSRRIGYQRLVLATGSEAMVPPIPGVDKKNVFSIKKDVPYLHRIVSAVDEANSLVIVGCGFIGVEIAEECRRRRPDLDISIVEMLERCLQLVYDEEFSNKAQEALQKQGIKLGLGERVSSLVGDDEVVGIELESGRRLDADTIILGIGVVPNVTLAKEAGLDIGPTGGIRVNRYMQTSDRRVFSCGDCAEKLSFFDGSPSPLKLASIATTEARVAGANLFQINRVNEGVIGFYSTVLGDCTFAAAGLTATQAEERGFDVLVGTCGGVNRHPACMPGAAELTVKLLFEAGSQVLIGGQVTGAKSGGELINAISACIQRRMTADDIATFQTGTHPALTASPVAYQLVNAAEIAIQNMKMRLPA
jgi:pyruvate/2-oxoglutarate dehydrogenase complex dihydrolipoamide dehydrogenase (E3) component